MNKSFQRSLNAAFIYFMVQNANLPPSGYESRLLSKKGNTSFSRSMDLPGETPNGT